MKFGWDIVRDLNGHAQGYKLTTKHALYIRRSISLEWDMGSIRRFFA
jgi:hypothetical protein